MKALDRKVLRDLASMRGQMLAIGLVIVAGVATYVSMQSVKHALESSLDGLLPRLPLRGRLRLRAPRPREPAAAAARRPGDPGAGDARHDAGDARGAGLRRAGLRADRLDPRGRAAAAQPARGPRRPPRPPGPRGRGAAQRAVRGGARPEAGRRAGGHHQGPPQDAPRGGHRPLARVPDADPAGLALPRPGALRGAVDGTRRPRRRLRHAGCVQRPRLHPLAGRRRREVIRRLDLRARALRGAGGDPAAGPDLELLHQRGVPAAPQPRPRRSPSSSCAWPRSCSTWWSAG